MDTKFPMQILIFILCLVLSGCSKIDDIESDNAINTSNAINNISTIDTTIEDLNSEFDARVVKVGDKVGEWIIDSLDLNEVSTTEYYTVVRFSGECEISGTLSFRFDDVGGEGDINYFEPNDESQCRIPVLFNDTGRTSLIIYDNSNEELSKLKGKGEKFSVTVLLSNYTLFAQGKGQYNSGTLIKLIDYEVQ